MYQMIIDPLLVLVALCAPSLAYVDGAKPESCYNHSVIHFQPFTNLPAELITCSDPCIFQVDVRLVLNMNITNVTVEDSLATTYKCHTYYQVIIRQAGPNGFQGLLIQARADTDMFTDDSNIYGEWLEDSSLLYKPLNCNKNISGGASSPNSATQRTRIVNDNPGTNLEVPLYWKLSDTNDCMNGPTVAFWYTIVQQQPSNYLPVKGPVLQAIACPSLSLTNGVITYAADTKPDFEIGTVATHSCNAGFALVGDMTRTCMVDDQADIVGVWSGSTPTCEPIDCPSISITNGVVMYAADTTSKFEIGTVATLTCNAGFALVGDMTRTCMDDDQADIVGVWSGSAPTCEPIDCPSISITNGVVMYAADTTSKFEIGTVATLTCNAGFALVGDMTRTCMDDDQGDIVGIWSGSAPTCEHATVTCPSEVNGGLLWPKTLETNRTTLPCSQAGSRFRQDSIITRTCLLGGVWSDVDLTSCTLESASSETFLIVYFSLSDHGVGQPQETHNLLLLEMVSVVNDTIMADNVMVNILSVSQNQGKLVVIYEIILASTKVSLTSFFDYFRSFSRLSDTLNFVEFAGYVVNEGGPFGIIGISPSESCECGSTLTSTSGSGEAVGSELEFRFIELCFGLSLSPCICTSSENCQCKPPYVGDGSRCTLDSDGDGYPDVALATPGCEENVEIPYCMMDVCPSVYNVDQNPAACSVITNTTDFTGCPFGPDIVWNIDWSNTERDTVNTQRCPGELDAVSGNATRYCDSNGEWLEPDVGECQSSDFVDIRDQAVETFSLTGNTSTTELVEQTVELTKQLADITQPSVIPLLPTSLNTTNDILTRILSVLEEAGNDTAPATQANEFVIDVFNNVLERNNTQGWMALQTSDAGSQVLLDNAERFGVLLARTQNNSESDQPVRISRPNIAVSAKQYNASKEVSMADLKFPQEEDLANYTLDFKPAEIQIPPGLLEERLSQQNNDAAGLPVVFILFQNLDAFLPASAGGLGDTTRGASVVISSQVGERGIPLQSQLLEESPVSLNFSFSSVENASEYRCVFWNFSQPIGNGRWIRDGVKTIGNSTDDSTITVECASTHLTSFAVLVDVAGGLKNITEAERTALEVVSYAGCVISVICLLISIIFFLTQWKKLLTSVHYFVHLNLSISLLLAYLVFIVGVETAVGNMIGCAFVAALLHYLFLSAFCWMLCEGVMLYLLLVVVFSRVAKQWWFFLLLGYLPPLPIVAITLAVRWQYYGVRDADGNLQFCWLSTEQGTIFGFVAPMLMIILINAVFCVFALRALWKSQKGQVKRKMSNASEKKQALHIAKSLLLASVVLLPLLGLTWVFGLLTVNSNTTVFAWIFTILNSLQGLAILFFHVIRNDTVWSKIALQFSRRKTHLGRSTHKRYNTYSRTSTSGGGQHSVSTFDRDTGTSTLKSTLPRDESLKQELSSSVSDYHSQHPETKVDLAGETTNDKLPTLQEQTENPISLLARGDFCLELGDLVIANPSANEDTSNKLEITPFMDVKLSSTRECNQHAKDAEFDSWSRDNGDYQSKDTFAVLWIPSGDHSKNDTHEETNVYR